MTLLYILHFQSTASAFSTSNKFLSKEIDNKRLMDFIGLQLDNANLRMPRTLRSEGSSFNPLSRLRRGGKCMFNSLAFNCDFRDAIGAANEASYWGASSPGR